VAPTAFQKATQTYRGQGLSPPQPHIPPASSPVPAGQNFPQHTPSTPSSMVSSFQACSAGAPILWDTLVVGFWVPFCPRMGWLWAPPQVPHRSVWWAAEWVNAELCGQGGWVGGSLQDGCLLGPSPPPGVAGLGRHIGNQSWEEQGQGPGVPASPRLQSVLRTTACMSSGHQQLQIQSLQPRTPQPHTPAFLRLTGLRSEPCLLTCASQNPTKLRLPAR
jgi:hypothetical protein